jgi:hypothetical protein
VNQSPGMRLRNHLRSFSVAEPVTGSSSTVLM